MQVNFRPWLGVGDVPPALDLVMEMTKTRCVFWDWKEPVWYLGERVVRHHSSDTFLVPHDPLGSMFEFVLLARALGQGQCYGGPGVD